MRNITADIKSGSFKPVYLLYGSEDYLKKWLRDRLKKAIVPDGDTMNYSYFDDTVLLSFSADTDKKDVFINKIEERLKDQNLDEELFLLDKKVIITNLVKMFENPAYVASMIYNNIIKEGMVINDAYSIYKNYTFDEFKDEFKNLNFDNKSILYVTKKEK